MLNWHNIIGIYISNNTTEQNKVEEQYNTERTLVKEPRNHGYH